ncbi:MAG: zinc ribbon domain-containing protein, partial [Promethearchaeota archaeon]
MPENYEYVWLIPLFGGIFTIIAVLTPVASFDMMGLSWSWWMWALSVMSASGLGSESVFISDVGVIIPSSITTGIMILSMISILTLAAKTRTRKLDTKHFESSSIIIGVIQIGITIYYLVAIDLAFYGGIVIEGVPFPAGAHFWEVFNPSFGIIGPFLSAFLAFTGAGVFRSYSKRRPDLMSTKMGTFDEKRPLVKSMEGLNFCPECGQKIISGTQRFCVNCG